MATTPVEQSPLNQIIQPFIDLVHAPRALWAVNLLSFLEGFVYFGMVIYLHMYFNQYGGLSDPKAGLMVGFLTWGITISMLFFGGRADAWGLRRTFIVALCIMFAGRSLLALAPYLGLRGGGFLTPFALVGALAITLVMTGYGMCYPAGYAAIRKFTTPATAGMGYAMLYAVMNLGGWLPTFMTPVRTHYGIRGAFAFYSAVTLVSLAALMLLLDRRTERDALAAGLAAQEAPAAPAGAAAPSGGLVNWLRNHPLADPKFSFFIFCLIPVQTLFAYNWLLFAPYVSRAFAGTWVGTHFEAASSLNTLLVFVLCPVVAALTTKVKVYTMMILGTAVMASPTFILALGPTALGLLAYIVLMSVGEAMWQPRFLQYAAEIAPEGRTGAYMGVAQFPWFLTKMLVSFYAGTALATWCPAAGPGRTGTMWFIFGSVAMLTTVMLILARGWLGKDFKTRQA
ncbi:MFS transporter [Mesoterricola silvestris]|uniref:MFS transporter n=1 Tax=Mesoterricola silvestris TaxID=2927979 RepID=A0AA48K7M3_9BACT|nr:MFS transporter [Mesoterricola silvestris]BDU72034.1 MFS transporter [Mesoterricola silvestris]